MLHVPGRILGISLGAPDRVTEVQARKKTPKKQLESDKDLQEIRKMLLESPETCDWQLV